MGLGHNVWSIRLNHDHQCALKVVTICWNYCSNCIMLLHEWHDHHTFSFSFMGSPDPQIPLTDATGRDTWLIAVFIACLYKLLPLHISAIDFWYFMSHTCKFTWCKTWFYQSMKITTDWCLCRLNEPFIRYSMGFCSVMTDCHKPKAIIMHRFSVRSGQIYFAVNGI